MLCVLAVLLVAFLFTACSSEKNVLEKSDTQDNSIVSDDTTKEANEVTVAVIDSTSKVEKHVADLTDEELLDLMEGYYDNVDGQSEFLLKVAHVLINYPGFSSMHYQMGLTTEDGRMYSDGVMEALRDYEGYVDPESFKEEDFASMEMWDEVLESIAKNFGNAVNSSLTYELPSGVSATFELLPPDDSVLLYNSDEECVGTYAFNYFPFFDAKDGELINFYYWFEDRVVNSYYQYGERTDDVICVVANITEPSDDAETTQDYWYVFFLRTDSYIYHSFSLDASIYSESDICALADSVEFKDDAFTLDLNAYTYLSDEFK